MPSNPSSLTYRISVATLILVVGQAIGLGIWIGVREEKLNRFDARLASVEIQIDNGSATYLTRQQVEDILGKYDEQMRSVEASLVDLKKTNDRIIDLLTR